MVAKNSRDSLTLHVHMMVPPRIPVRSIPPLNDFVASPYYKKTAPGYWNFDIPLAWHGKPQPTTQICSKTKNPWHVLVSVPPTLYRGPHSCCHYSALHIAHITPNRHGLNARTLHLPLPIPRATFFARFGCLASFSLFSLLSGLNPVPTHLIR